MNMNKKLYSTIDQDARLLLQLPLPWEELKNKRIFITGGTGFIGSGLVKTFCQINNLLPLNMTIGLLYRGVACPTPIAPCVRWIQGDISQDFIPERFMPDIIIHAASPANQRSILVDPAGVVNCNILAVRYLLESAQKSNAVMLFFSSGEVYQRQQGRITEVSAEALAKNSLLSLYGCSKLTGELLCEQYRRRYGIDCRILRPFSVFGPGEALTSGRCFTDFLRQALETHAIQVSSPGTQIRSYCYISDFVSGLLYVLLKGANATYNIGNEDNTCTILELARQIALLNGNTTVEGPFGLAAGTDSFVPDTTKLRQLGWQPQINLQTCIKRCLDSYQ